MKFWRKMDIAWAAGFIDGEGCIIATYQSRNKCFGTQLNAYQTLREPLDFLEELFGGSVHKITPRNRNAKQCWVWRLNSHNSSRAVRLMLPYLRVKNRQAKLFLELRDSFTAAHACRNRPIPQDVMEKRLFLVSQIKTLNKRGVK